MTNGYYKYCIRFLCSLLLKEWVEFCMQPAKSMTNKWVSLWCVGGVAAIKNSAQFNHFQFSFRTTADLFVHPKPICAKFIETTSNQALTNMHKKKRTRSYPKFASRNNARKNTPAVFNVILMHLICKERVLNSRVSITRTRNYI